MCSEGVLRGGIDRVGGMGTKGGCIDRVGGWVGGCVRTASVCVL